VIDNVVERVQPFVSLAYDRWPVDVDKETAHFKNSSTPYRDRPFVAEAEARHRTWLQAV
jgi:hypothetical protein